MEYKTKCLLRNIVATTYSTVVESVRIGIFAFFLIIIFIYILIKLLQINFLFGACYLAILVRGLTDTTFLAGSSFNYILFFFLLYSTTVE